MDKLTKGDRVQYKKTGEKGVVSSTNEWYVFVKYDNIECVMLTGDEPYIAQATSRGDLVKIER